MVNNLIFGYIEIAKTRKYDELKKKIDEVNRTY